MLFQSGAQRVSRQSQLWFRLREFHRRDAEVAEKADPSIRAGWQM
jgi:hypothetical protein